MTNLKKYKLPAYRAAKNNNAEEIVADIIAAAAPNAQKYLRGNAEFFAWLAAGSPYLARLCRLYPDVLEALLDTAPADYCARLRAELRPQDFTDREEWMSALRIARNKISLAVGLADAAELWDVEAVVGEMSALADFAVAASIEFLMQEAVAGGVLKTPAPTGLVVLALGKHGGEELNYSSDIDIVLYYTAGACEFATPPEKTDERKFFVSLVRDLTHILQHRTQDGYVFRVDLRLRPDPSATPVAISVSAALSYYESMGQNWERAVYIKARPIGGDIAAGKDFIAQLRPYIWRRYFDFASIEDVHSMKRQIHANFGAAQVAAHGHNVKLGRGGIREIEFFVQTQQLIAGGRDDGLRGTRTTQMLAALAEHNWISDDVAAGLTKAYYFLRRIEHRLQMQNDEQTQTLPTDADDFAAFASFAGYKTTQEFEEELLSTLTYVSGEYSRLFESADSLAGAGGNLVFVGNEDDPDTLETLQAMGFARPQLVSQTMRGWHTGRIRATRSTRSREILTRLAPTLLQALAQGGDPDDAFVKFDSFLSALPSGVQFFSLIQTLPHVLDILVRFITAAPHLSHRLSSDAHLLDMLIENRLPPQKLPPLVADDFQEDLDRLRIGVHEMQFAACVQMMSEPTSAARQGEYFATTAEQALAALLPAALKDIEERYGKLDGGEIALIGMGKLGSRELALQSDLDLIIICDNPADAAASHGGKTSIDADKYFARAARHILNGITAPTANGKLYEVDTRLRPSGQAGPLVTKYSSFKTYQQKEAWAWEHMALTRARVVASSGGELGARLERDIHSIICAPRDAAALAEDVGAMWERLNAHHAPAPQENYSVKHGDGGLVALEFICQSLQLAHAAAHPALAQPAPLPQVLDSLAEAGCLSANRHNQLRDAARLFATTLQITSLCRDRGEDFHPTASGLALLLAAVNMPSASALQDAIAEHRGFVAATLEQVLRERFAIN